MAAVGEVFGIEKLVELVASFLTETSTTLNFEVFRAIIPDREFEPFRYDFLSSGRSLMRLASSYMPSIWRAGRKSTTPSSNLRRFSSGSDDPMRTSDNV